MQISNNWSVVALEVVAKMGAKAPLLVFPTWGAQPLASEDAAQRRAGLLKFFFRWYKIALNHTGTLLHSISSVS